MKTTPSLNEIHEKERRVHNLLVNLGYDSLILCRRENFSWFTCGGEAVTSHVSSISPVYLVITPARKYAVGYVMDIPRTMDEELSGQGYEAVAIPSFSKTMNEVVKDLAQGKVASDDVFTGAESIGDAVVKLHEPFTPEEMARYRDICAESSSIMWNLANWVKPGMTERYVFAEMWRRYLEHGFEGNCMFVGADQRIRKYRHTVPTDLPIENTVVISPAVSKYGLHVVQARMVHFGQLSADIRKRYDAIALMQATMLSMARPGMPLNGLLQTLFRIFNDTGYAKDISEHFHGNPLGYRVGYAERMLDLEERVKPNMALGFYLTISGVKDEELLLIRPEETQMATLEQNWPRISVIVDGKPCEVPDILMR